jgi:hypothetical protein
MPSIRPITAVLLAIVLSGLTGCVIWPYDNGGGRGGHEQQDRRGDQHENGHGDHGGDRR